MPFRDDKVKTEYQREYMRKRRAGEAKPKKAKPAAPEVEVTHGLSDPEAAAARIAELEVQVAQLRANGSEITIEMLSMSDRKKAEKFRRKLERDFAWKLDQRVLPEVQRRTEDLRQYLWKEEAKAKELQELWSRRLNGSGVAGAKGLIDRRLFRRILARLHPDSGGTADVFNAFKALEDYLLPSKDVLEERTKRKRK
jgi:hypothetical protein